MKYNKDKSLDFLNLFTASWWKLASPGLDLEQGHPTRVRNPLRAAGGFSLQAQCEETTDTEKQSDSLKGSKSVSNPM